MSEATKGRAREHRIAREMADVGWELIARAAASKGPADLIVAHPEHGVALVQVGLNKALGPADRARLTRAAHLCSALPILARIAPRQPTVYLLVTDDLPRTWEVWTP